MGRTFNILSYFMQSDMSRSTLKSSAYPCRSYSGYKIISEFHTAGVDFSTAFFLTSSSKNWLCASLKFFCFAEGYRVQSPCMFPTQTSSLATFLRLDKSFQAVPIFFHPKIKRFASLLQKKKYLAPTSKKLCIQAHESSAKKKWTTSV